MEKIVIVGSGPAGLTAAIYAARADLAPLVVEGVQPGGQLTTTTDVENFPGFPGGMDGTALVGEMRKQAERFGARFVSDEVAGADFRSRPLSIALGDGSKIEAKTFIIATGASARYLGLESERKLRGRGVSACATCDGALFRGVPLAVVGGGDTAMEESLFLTRFATRVTLIHRRDQFRASKIMIERVLNHPKIDVLRNTVVEEVLDVAANEVTGLRLRNVATGSKSELAVRGLFLAVGHTPNTEPFKGQVELDETGYLVVRGARTSVEGVFAAGDVHDHSYRQAITAAGFGCMAALEAQRYLEAMGQ